MTETTAETNAETTAETTVEPEKEPELLFEDDFDGTEIDPKRWTRSKEQLRQGASWWDDDYIKLDGEGHLVISAAYEDDGLVHAGAVSTRNNFYGRLGYYEASIKFPKAYGTWGAFWIYAGDPTMGNPKFGIEIDVVESIHNEEDKCSHALHWQYSPEKKRESGSLPANIYDGEYHTFGCLRSEDGYFFYIDGKLTWSVKPEQVAVSKMSGHLILSVEAATWAGAKTQKSKDELPADMVVDWVRVWSAKPEG